MIPARIPLDAVICVLYLQRRAHSYFQYLAALSPLCRDWNVPRITERGVFTAYYACWTDDPRDAR